MFKSLPIELYYKILNYGAVVPLHFTAYKTAKVRPIFSCELNSNLSDNNELILEESDDELNTDEEYYMFLLNQNLF